MLISSITPWSGEVRERAYICCGFHFGHDDADPIHYEGSCKHWRRIWISYIPLSVLAAILIVVSYNMGEWHEISKLLKLTWADISVWAITFALTVFADLTVAVETGIVLAALLYIRKVTGTTTVTRVTAQYVEEGWLHILQDKPIPEYVAVFRIHGPF